MYLSKSVMHINQGINIKSSSFAFDDENCENPNLKKDRENNQRVNIIVCVCMRVCVCNQFPLHICKSLDKLSSSSKDVRGLRPVKLITEVK